MTLRGLTAIDLGSHEGYNSLDLFESGCASVVGIEIRDRYVEVAREEARKLGYTSVSFLKADVRTIDEQGLGRFDLCLCTGLLYHMQNPFNLLKRIRNICKVMALETHIAPSFLNLFAAGNKYRCNLTWMRRTVTLDGRPFTGRLNVFPPSQDMQKTSGSVVSHSTFWLDQGSLLKALDLAGFRTKAVYFGVTPTGFPDILVDHGRSRTKVFVLAEVKDHDGPPEKVEPGKMEGCPRLVVVA
jgi:hypothetical protein